MKKRFRTAIGMMVVPVVAGLFLTLLFWSPKKETSYLEAFAGIYFMFGGVLSFQGICVLLGILPEEDKHSVGLICCAIIYYGGFVLKSFIDVYCHSEAASYILGYLIVALAVIAVRNWWKAFNHESENKNGHNT